MILHFLQAILLGIVQGITEPLPVSSTAHLVIIERLFGLDQTIYGLTFDMFINIGTTAAVITFFWSDLKTIFSRLRLPSQSQPLDKNERMPWLLLAATIPAGIAGLLLEKRIASDFRSYGVIAASLIIVGVIMLLVDKKTGPESRLDHSKEVKEPQIWNMGFSQILALIPGVSRSGITISTGIASGMTRVKAAQYSFLLSVPITLAAILKRLLTFILSVIHHQVSGEVIVFYLIGAIAAWITAYLTLKFLLRFYSKYSLATFAYYRFALAIIILIIMRF